MFTFGEGDFACPVAQYENITEKRTREVIVPPDYRSDCEGVLFAYELVGALLPFSGRVVIGEIVTIAALTGSAVRAVEDGEGEAR